MAHDAGKVTQGISGKKIIRLIIIASFLLFAPFLAKHVLPKLKVSGGQPSYVVVGESAKAEVKQFVLDPVRWSPVIYIRPGNSFNVTPTSGGYVEFLPDGTTEPIRINYGEEKDLGINYAFRIKGEGVAIVSTSPMP